MNIRKLARLENLDAEKADWIEKQVNRNLEFRFESKEILRRETHTVLTCLFAIMVGAGGYVMKLIEVAAQPVPWWQVGPLTGVTVSASVVAAWLIWKALRIDTVLPPGNEPDNLIKDEVLDGDFHLMRADEANNLQQRIETITACNQRVGDAITKAWWALIAIPSIGLIAAAIWRANAV